MMKQTTPILITIFILISCGNSSQTKAIEQAKDIQSAIKPDTVATSANGFTMKANIDGRNWEAASMMPPEAAGRIVGYYNDQYIELPYSKTDIVAGKKIVLGEDNAVDLFLNDGCLWKDIKGEVEITKADEQWAEGKFFFTTVCNRTGKATEVTNGFFRIPVAKN